MNDDKLNKKTNEENKQTFIVIDWEHGTLTIYYHLHAGL